VICEAVCDLRISQVQVPILRSSEMLSEVVHILESQDTIHDVPALCAEAAENTACYTLCRPEDGNKKVFHKVGAHALDCTCILISVVPTHTAVVLQFLYSVRPPRLAACPSL
jgi:hypothetical protein